MKKVYRGEIYDAYLTKEVIGSEQAGMRPVVVISADKYNAKKNNITKFPDDFRFQLTQEEVDELSRSKILTSMQALGTKGGRTYRPFAFSEQGIYMLMTVLKGELATKQSIALVRLFKGMKDYLAENQ